MYRKVSAAAVETAGAEQTALNSALLMCSDKNPDLYSPRACTLPRGYCVSCRGTCCDGLGAKQRTFSQNTVPDKEGLTQSQIT